MIKEGSIGSLLVKLPWKGSGCQVEVNELELVLAPYAEDNLPAGVETCNSGQDGYQDLNYDLGKLDHEAADRAAKSSTGDVHEGVKTIAKMVKWFLTSFHVKIKKLIVAFDPNSIKDKRKFGSPTALVLRISETECGTCVSDDANPRAETKAENFFGISQLTNFVKFHGAVVELLEMNGFNAETCFPCMEPTQHESSSGPCMSSAPTPIMTGQKGGFSGNLKLSIPWKNGSLDIRKVDADVSIDPVELRFQPSTIEWLLRLWDTFKKLEKDGSCHNKSTDTVQLSSASNCLLSKPGSTAILTPKHGQFSGLTSLTVREPTAEALQPGPHLISDWVPLSTDKSNKVGVVEELDFGARLVFLLKLSISFSPQIVKVSSFMRLFRLVVVPMLLHLAMSCMTGRISLYVYSSFDIFMLNLCCFCSVDQFFECFDGMRNSQSALGSSGMWNWTCSVFSAITAASSLASGSLHVPSGMYCPFIILQF